MDPPSVIQPKSMGKNVLAMPNVQDGTAPVQLPQPHPWEVAWAPRLVPNHQPDPMGFPMVFLRFSHGFPCSKPPIIDKSCILKDLLRWAMELVN